jgi:hypothetical protein
MRRSFRQTALAITVVVAILLTSAPLAAAASYSPMTAQDGDGVFQQFAASAATRIPTSQQTSPLGIQTDTLGQTVNFWAYDYQLASYYQTSATTVRLSAHAAIFVETGLNVAPSVLDDIVSKWENKIYPTDRATFGSEPSPGIDGDARVTLLLLNIRDGQYHGAGSYITGYFSAVNEYRQSDLDTWFPTLGQKSNQREMLFLDAANPTEVGAASFDGTIAHEFQHMIHWGLDSNEEAWVNEGLSDLATYLAGFGHANNHINAFMSSPDDALTNWSGTLADYGASYLFFLYVWEKYGGADTIHAIAASTQHGIAGINAALTARGLTVRFADIFASWTVANYLGDPTFANGLYGYSTLSLVDAGADGVNSFLRPKLTASFGAYAASGPGTVRSWSAQYQKFTGGNGGLNVAFSGADNGNFSVTLVKSTSAAFARGTNSVETVQLTPAQAGSLTVPTFGTIYAAALLIAANRSTTVSPASYTASATLSVAPTPTPSPTAKPTVTPVPTQQPVPAPGTVTMTIALQAGWNLISLSADPVTPLTAEGLIRLISLQGGQATDVNRWQAGAWNTHLAGLAFNDFAVEPGRGYFVKAVRASTVSIAGRAMTSASSVSLAAGWNLVAFPSVPAGQTAETLLQSMSAQGIKVLEIDRWSGGSWNAHLTGLPFGDYPIEAGAAYFIRASQAGAWTH